MFDLGWSEMLLLVVVAIVVIGPKDLPRAMRTVGQWVGKARAVAREFQGHIDEMVRESELDELRKQANSVLSLENDGRRAKPANPTGGDGAFDPAPEAADDGAPPDPAAQTGAEAPDRTADNVTPLPRAHVPPAGAAQDAGDEAGPSPDPAQAATLAGAGEPKATR